jgi:hypothetical protein
MSIKNLTIAVAGIIAAIILVSLLWRTPIFLIFCLIIVTLLKRIFAPVPHEFAMFSIVGILGPVTESLIMLSGVWSYARPHIFNFPIWLPFLWGLAGTLFVTIYHALPHRSK